MKKQLIRFIAAAGAVSGIAVSVSAFSPAAYAEDEENVQTIVTEYSDLWNGTISAKPGKPIKWYVNVPEGTALKGCGATIKIPDLGWGTDSHNKEEGHLTLQEGENFIYEFTPEETGDILFTCWMGSNCHYNFIHITVDGTYDLKKPDDPDNISAVRDGENVSVSFEAPENPDNVEIRGYKVTALAEDGTRVKASGKESPITLEGADKSKSYTISIVTLSNAGKSAGAGSYVLESEPAETTETTTASADTAETTTTAASETTQTTQSTTTTTTAAASKSDSSSPKTGVAFPAASALLLLSSLGTALFTRKKDDID